ncbi:MAG: hypothetical protein IJ244_07185 [Bacteroidaceae bacterium]|nr:hypothetical protein [Bacteroidaceae bacterium]
MESITCTKFGILIVLHPNTEGFSQRCEELQYLPASGPKKKRCKQLMKL